MHLRKQGRQRMTLFFIVLSVLSFGISYAVTQTVASSLVLTVSIVAMSFLCMNAWSVRQLKPNFHINSVAGDK